MWVGVSSQYRIALNLVNDTVTILYNLNTNINYVIVPLQDQHKPHFIFMDDNGSAHQGRIIREQLLETGVL